MTTMPTVIVTAARPKPRFVPRRRPRRSPKPKRPPARPRRPATKPSPKVTPRITPKVAPLVKRVLGRAIPALGVVSTANDLATWLRNTFKIQPYQPPPPIREVPRSSPGQKFGTVAYETKNAVLDEVVVTGSRRSVGRNPLSSRRRSNPQTATKPSVSRTIADIASRSSQPSYRSLTSNRPSARQSRPTLGRLELTASQPQPVQATQRDCKYSAPKRKRKSCPDRGYKLRCTQWEKVTCP